MYDDYPSSDNTLLPQFYAGKCRCRCCRSEGRYEPTDDDPCTAIRSTDS